MRLTEEDIQRHKENIYSVECIRDKVKMSDGDIIHNLCDTIEALRLENVEWQENYEELDAGHSKLYKAYCEIKQENEQLQAQAARMREALIIANHRMPDAGQFCACGNCKICGADINYVGYEHCVKCARVIIDEALSDTPTTYHNPADVAALEKARETLKSVSYRAGLGSDEDGIREALAAIDKVIGGKEDANV